MPIHILKEPQGNCMRNCWAHIKQHGLAVTKRGELHYMRLRHAGDTQPEGFM